MSKVKIPNDQKVMPTDAVLELIKAEAAFRSRSASTVREQDRLRQLLTNAMVLGHQLAFLEDAESLRVHRRSAEVGLKRLIGISKGG